MERAKISLGAPAILSLIYQLHYTCIRFFAIFIMSIAIKHIWFLLSNQWFPMLHVSVWLDWTFVIIIIISLQSNGLSLRTSITVVNRILMGYFPSFQISCGMKDGKLYFKKRQWDFSRFSHRVNTTLHQTWENFLFCWDTKSEQITDRKERKIFF